MALGLNNHCVSHKTSRHVFDGCAALATAFHLPFDLRERVEFACRKRAVAATSRKWPQHEIRSFTVPEGWHHVAEMGTHLLPGVLEAPKPRQLRFSVDDDAAEMRYESLMDLFE
jgi:hypothetical protein